MSKKVWPMLPAFLLLLHLEATTYYISPSGDDDANGRSPHTAWRTIDRVNQLDLHPGDRILFEAGQTFSGTLLLDEGDANDPSRLVVISAYGPGRATINSGKNTAIWAYNTSGYRISELILTGSGMMTSQGSGLYFYTDLPDNKKLEKLILQDLEIRDFGQTGLAIGAWNGNSGFADVTIENVYIHHVRENGINIYGYFSPNHKGYAHRNVVLRYIEVHDVPGYAADQHKGSGIIMAQVDGGLIEYALAHHNGRDNTHCGGPGGIWAWDSNEVTIQFCESHHNSAGSGCDGLGFDLDGGMTNSVLQYNYSHDNDGAGFLLGQFETARPWQNNTVRYNISENDGRVNVGGITLFKAPGTRMSGARIYHNTVYMKPAPANPEPGALTMVKWHSDMRDITLYNNIFYTTGGVPLLVVPPGYDAFFAGNLYWSGNEPFTINYGGKIYHQLDDWRWATGNERLSGRPTGLVEDPRLLQAGAPAMEDSRLRFSEPSCQLQPTSPGIDQGLDLTLFGIDAGGRDLWRNLAPQGEAPDIGAFESKFKGIDKGTDPIAAEATDAGVWAQLFPNPVLSGQPVHLRAARPIGSAALMDAGGRITRTLAPDVTRLETAGLSPGLYFLLLKDENNFLLRLQLVIQQ